MADRWLMWAAALGLLLLVQLGGRAPHAGSQTRATLEPTAAAATATAIAALASPTPTVTATAAPTATCAPGPQCVYLTTLERQPAPSPTPLPPAVRVLSSRSYDQAGYRYVIGEVQNDTSAPVVFVQVSADWRNGEGALVDTASSYTMLERLAPGQRSPFQIIVLTPAPSAAGYQLRVAWDTPTRVRSAPVTVLSATARADGGYTRVTGQVRNDSGQALRFVEVVVTLSDGGQVAQVGSSYSDPVDLAPGAVGVYEIFISGDYASLSPVAQAEGDTP